MRKSMKKIIKKYISSLLVASMGFSLLAPALAINAQAEETDFLSKRGTISFDLGIYKTFKEHENQTNGEKYLLDPVLKYNKGDKSEAMKALGVVTAQEQKRRKYEVLFAKKGDTDEKYFNEYIEDTGKNNQDKKSVNIPKNTVEMPWWNFDWKDFDRKISEYQSHIDVTHITFPNVYEQPDLKPWNGVKYYFPGYVLEKWYDKSDITQTPVNKLPLEFPYVSTTYVAKFKSDGYRYTLTTKHVPAREGINPPINHVNGHENDIIDNPLEDDKQVKLDTDQSYQMRPINIPGYKASLADSDIKITDPRSNTPDKNFNVPDNSYNKIYAWTKDSDNNLGGQVFNKNVEATYKYDVDESQKFYVIVKHKRMAQDGSILNTTVDKYPFAAETDLSTKNIVPKDEYIKPKEVGGQAPYLLGKGLKAPSVTSGQVANESTHLSGLKYVDGKYFDTNGRLIGKMPNQNVIIEYTYEPNPNYKLNINVRYEDGNGRSIAKKVLEQKRTDGVDYYEPLGVDSSGIVNVLLAQNTKTNIPLPELQGYEEPNVVITSNVTLAGTAEKDMPNHILKLTMADTSYDIKVVYTQKAQDFGKLIFDTGDHLKLKFDDRDYDPNQDFIYLEKDRDGNLIIPKSISENEDMKKLKADSALGYDLEGFYAQDGDKEIRLLDEKKSFINQESSVDAYSLKPIKGDTYRLRAKAKKRSTDVKKWFNIEFEYKPGENKDVTVDDYKTSLSFYPYINNEDDDITKRAFNLKAFKELVDNKGEVTAEHGIKIHVPYEGEMPNIEVPEHYKLKWYDGDSDREIEENELLYYDKYFYDRRFKLVARVVKDQPLQFTKPQATSAINTYTGHIKMIVSQLNPDPLVQYVLTDESGNVIYKTTSEKLAEAKKTIENENIIPGRKYKLYEIAPGYKVHGKFIGHEDIRKSEPCEVLAKIAGDPIFLANENDKVDTTFEDLHPGMQYALRKKDGTLVSDWQRPQDKKLTFKALDPDEEYELIVKSPSENFDVTQAPKGFEFRTKLETGIYKLIIANGENQKYIKEAKQILKDGSEADVDLNNIKPGTTLIIKVQPFVDGLSFQGDAGIKLRYGNPGGFSSFNNECKFTMPRSNVMLELVYANVNANVNPYFEDPEINDYQDHQGDISPTKPNIDVGGVFKVEFNRKKATVSEAKKIDNLQKENQKFKPIDILQARLLEKTGTDWHLYNDGSEKTIRTNIMIGGLEKKNREYKIFKLTPDGNNKYQATDEESISEDSLRSGYFAKEFLNNELYLFGYYESELYKLKIIKLKKNNNNNNDKVIYEADIKASENNALSDYERDYADSLQKASSNYIRDGITYTYKGLSTSKDSLESPDFNLPIKGDMSLYLFYDDDSVQRQKIESELKNSLEEVKNRLNNNELKQAYDNAKRTVDNKATTGDLQLALNKLRQALGLPNNGDSSGGSGSGGHGGFAGGRNNLGAGSLGLAYKGYSVGRDGNWKLLDKDKHIWIFELNDGQRIKGWANLSYTYDAVRRVETYHFAADGVMDYGWFLDENGDWYYMSELHDGFFGHMVRSWYKDDKDGHWYYLSEKNGKMLKAWQKIGGSWYYLNPQNQTEPTWSFDAQKQKWIYIGNTQIRPLGSMYKNERTPDNYYVNDSGAWVEGK